MLNRFLFLFLISINLFASESDVEEAKKLIDAYPAFLKEYNNGYILWHDGTKMLFDDQKVKNSYENLLNSPSLKDTLSQKYIKTIEIKDYFPQENEDAGRIRNEAFFKKMYGNNQEEIENNLVFIKWLANSQNKTLQVTKINGINKKLIAISNEIEKLPKNIKKFAQNPSGVYNFRKISNTNRLSVHSFAIAIDIDVKNSNYWLWDKQKNGKFLYKNKIPLEIVEIFEKHGFIWGGRWYHYDTMHFEYRPELLNCKEEIC